MVGIERVIDAVAHHLGMDPLEVCKRNFYPHKLAAQHGTTPMGSRYMTVFFRILSQSWNIQATIKSDATRLRRSMQIRCDQAGHCAHPVKFGISFNTSFLNQAGALIHIYSDGSVHLNHGGTEMGQGLNIKIAQIVAHEFQIPLRAVKITATSTGKVPNTCYSCLIWYRSERDGGTVCGADIKTQDGRISVTTGRHRPCSGRFADNQVIVGTDRRGFADAVRQCYLGRVSLSATGFYATPKIHWDKSRLAGRPFYYYAYGAACSEVAVDMLTGESRILRTDILHDGKSLNPAIDIGQIEGGFVQGAGWLTTEELVWGAGWHAF